MNGDGLLFFTFSSLASTFMFVSFKVKILPHTVALTRLCGNTDLS